MKLAELIQNTDPAIADAEITAITDDSRKTASMSVSRENALTDTPLLHRHWSRGRQPLLQSVIWDWVQDRSL